MRRNAILVVAAMALSGVVAYRAPASGQADGEAAPIYGVELPPGYRDWRLISVARVGSPLNDLRAKLGNDVAIKAYREGKLPFPDGTIVARLAWRQVPPEEDDRVTGHPRERRSSLDSLQMLLAESVVAGPPTNVQVMVKDSRRFASSGGWGFAQFDDGRPADEAVHTTCLPCHEPAKARDFVFTRYAP